MKSWTTKKGTRIFQLLGGRCNVYAIATNDGIILVDTGKSEAYTRLIKRLKELGISEISHLFLTHTHFDHCQSAHKLKNKFACKIIASEKAVKFAAAGYTQIPEGSLPALKTLSRLGQKIGKQRFGYTPFHIDMPIKEKTQLTAHIYIIETPGHSIDSITIVVDNEIALVGDNLLGMFKNSVYPPFVDDEAQMINSWNLLLESKCCWFLPGHRKPIHRKLLEKEYQKFRMRSVHES